MSAEEAAGVVAGARNGLATGSAHPAMQGILQGIPTASNARLLAEGAVAVVAMAAEAAVVAMAAAAAVVATVAAAAVVAMEMLRAVEGMGGVEGGTSRDFIWIA